MLFVSASVLFSLSIALFATALSAEGKHTTGLDFVLFFSSVFVSVVTLQNPSLRFSEQDQYRAAADSFSTSFDAAQHKRRFTIDDLANSTLQPKFQQVQWLTGGFSLCNLPNKVLIPGFSEIGIPGQYVFSAENGDILLGDMNKPDANPRILLPKDGILDVCFAARQKRSV